MADSTLELLNADESPMFHKIKGAQTEGDPGVPYVALDSEHAPSTTVTEDYITISVVDTEYSKALPTNCKAFSFRCVDSTKLNAGSDIRYAFTTGKVATPTLPFQMLDGGAVYSQNNLNLSSKTLYVAGITAGDIVLLEMWS